MFITLLLMLIILFVLWITIGRESLRKGEVVDVWRTECDSELVLYISDWCCCIARHYN